jgi:hypothetical protein
VRFERSAVRTELIPERDKPRDSFSAPTLRRQRRPSAGTDQSPLVLPKRIHEPTHEDASRIIALCTFACRRDEPCASPKGSAVQVSVWDSEEHAAQLDRLKEMIVDARREAEACGVSFHPIVNYPIDWTI